MGAPSRLPEERDFYTRRLIYSDAQCMVESRCSRCGTLIIGSATQHLIADELQHMRKCIESSEGSSGSTSHTQRARRGSTASKETYETPHPVG